jgi:hypothetical protein
VVGAGRIHILGEFPGILGDFDGEAGTVVNQIDSEGDRAKERVPGMGTTTIGRLEDIGVAVGLTGETGMARGGPSVTMKLVPTAKRPEESGVPLGPGAHECARHSVRLPET